MKIVESKLVTVMLEGFYGSVSNNAIIEVDRRQFSQDKLEIGTYYDLYCSFVYEKNE